jgi:hypothetical protein
VFQAFAYFCWKRTTDKEDYCDYMDHYRFMRYDEKNKLKGLETAGFEEELIEFEKAIGNKYPLLIVIELENTLFCKKIHKELSSRKKKKGLKASFIHEGEGHSGKYAYYLRPGARDLILRLLNHPRVQLGLYSTMNKVDTIEVTHHLLRLLPEIDEKVL